MQPHFEKLDVPTKVNTHATTGHRNAPRFIVSILRYTPFTPRAFDGNQRSPAPPVASDLRVLMQYDSGPPNNFWRFFLIFWIYFGQPGGCCNGRYSTVLPPHDHASHWLSLPPDSSTPDSS